MQDSHRWALDEMVLSGGPRYGEAAFEGKRGEGKLQVAEARNGCPVECRGEAHQASSIKHTHRRRLPVDCGVQCSTPAPRPSHSWSSVFWDSSAQFPHTLMASCSRQPEPKHRDCGHQGAQPPGTQSYIHPSSVIRIISLTRLVGYWVLGHLTDAPSHALSSIGPRNLVRRHSMSSCGW